MANSFYFVDGDANTRTIYIVGGGDAKLSVNRDSEVGAGPVKIKRASEHTPNKWANQHRGVTYETREYGFTAHLNCTSSSDLETYESNWRTWHDPELGEGYIKRITPGGTTRCLDCVPIPTDPIPTGGWTAEIEQRYEADNPWWRDESQSTAGGTLNTAVTIDNGGFETFTGTAEDGTSDDFANWTETNNDGNGNKTEASTTQQAGTYAAKLTYGNAESSMQHANITVTAGKKYTLAFYTRGDGAASGQYLIYDVSNSADIQAKTSTGVAGTDYTQVSCAFTAPAGCSSIYVTLYSPSGAGTAWFDAVTLEETTIDIECENAGEIPAWPVITFTGITTNPSVTNSDGDVIAVTVTTVNADDTVTIDCRPNGTTRRSAYSQEHGAGTRTYRAISSASTFITLATGTNDVTVTTSGLGNEVTVEVAWYNYYGGLI